MRTVRLILMLALAALAGCGKKQDPAPVIEEGNGAQPTPTGPSVAQDSVVGKWQSAAAAGTPVDWTFLDAGLNGKSLILRITGDGKFLPMIVDEVSGPFARYELAGNTLDVKAESGQSKKLRVIVANNELTLSDDVGGALKFTRVPAVAAQVKINNLPLCCEGCGLSLTQILQKSPGVSDIVVDTKGRSVSLELSDEEQARGLPALLAQAGMRGDLVVNGSLLAFSGPTVVANPTDVVKIREVVLKNVHVCCPECEDSIKKLLKDDVAGKFTFSRSAETARARP
jgi:hypothetical protein